MTASLDTGFDLLSKRKSGYEQLKEKGVVDFNHPLLGI
jgi:hypothetical protein